jgi:hypothetical protein
MLAGFGLPRMFRSLPTSHQHETQLSATRFFVAESVALEICARPNKALAEVAVLCAQHQHRQASRAGHVALSRIQALET